MSELGRHLCVAEGNARLVEPLASKPATDGTPTADASSVFELLGGRSCDYSKMLPDPPTIPAA